MNLVSLMRWFYKISTMRDVYIIMNEILLKLYFKVISLDGQDVYYIIENVKQFFFCVNSPVLGKNESC